MGWSEIMTEYRIAEVPLFNHRLIENLFILNKKQQSFLLLFCSQYHLGESCDCRCSRDKKNFDTSSAKIEFFSYLILFRWWSTPAFKVLSFYSYSFILYDDEPFFTVQKPNCTSHTGQTTPSAFHINALAVILNSFQRRLRKISWNILRSLLLDVCHLVWWTDKVINLLLPRHFWRWCFDFLCNLS